MLTHLDLFSGMGGFSIAAEAAGFTTVAFAETDPDASSVLNYWWPEVPNLGDVCEAEWHWPVDLLTGGVPCQPTSHVGLMRGTADSRWMWPAAIRAMRLFRPRVAVYENPPALLILEGGRAFNGIVSEMVALGYDLWWDIFPAAAFGAGHLRRRLIIVATDAVRSRGQPIAGSSPENETERRGRARHESARLEQASADAHDGRDWEQPDAARTNGQPREAEQARSGSRENAPNANGQRWAQARQQCLLEGQQAADDLRRQSTSSSRETSPNASGETRRTGLRTRAEEQQRGRSCDAPSEAAADTELARLQRYGRLGPERSGASVLRRPVAPSDLRGRVERIGPNGEDWWSEIVTGVPVLAHGLPNKLVEAISRCTGNAVVPQTLVPLLQAVREMI